MINQSARCYGCGICAIVCPTNAIIIEQKDGFWLPSIDKKRCVNCSKCSEACPVNNRQYEKELPQKIFYSKTKEIEKLSSSGGLSVALTRSTIKNARGVCGVRYSAENIRAEHIVIYKTTDVKKIQGSKYLASYTVDGFRKIIQDGCGTVFGTPCQIAGLNNYLQKKGNRDKYLLVDIFCHGVPNNLVWENHMNDINHRFDCDDNAVSFRDKKIYRLKIGKYNKDAQIEPFLHYFLTAQINREECYSCPYRRLSTADIRLGDYYKHGDPTSYSVVVPMTKQGENALHNIVDEIDIFPLEYDLMDKVQEKGNRKIPKTRDYILMKSQQGIPPRVILGKRKLLLQYIKGYLKKIINYCFDK